MQIPYPFNKVIKILISKNINTEARQQLLRNNLLISAIPENGELLLLWPFQHNDDVINVASKLNRESYENVKKQSIKEMNGCFNHLSFVFK